MSDFFTSLLARAQERAPVLHWRRPALFESAPIQAGPEPEPQASPEPRAARALTASSAAPMSMPPAPLPGALQAAPDQQAATSNPGPQPVQVSVLPAPAPILPMPAPAPAWKAMPAETAEATGTTTLIERHEIHHQHYHLQRAADLATIRSPGTSSGAADSHQEAALAALRMPPKPSLISATEHSDDARLSSLQAEQEAQARSLEQGMREIQSARRVAEQSAAQARTLAANSARSNSLRPKPSSASADAALLAQAALAGLARQAGQRGMAGVGGAAPAAPKVQVHIGRIEVRASTPAATGGQVARRTHTPQMSLDDYLRQRTEKR